MNVRMSAVSCLLLVLGGLPACSKLKSLTGEASERGAWEGGTPVIGEPSPTGAGAVGSGASIVIAPKTEKAWGVGLDGPDLYFTSSGKGTQGIRRVPRIGGTPVTVCTIANELNSPREVFFDETHVYTYSVAIGPSFLVRAPKSGTNVPCETVTSSGGLVNRGLTKLGGTIYVSGDVKGGSQVQALDSSGKARPFYKHPKPITGMVNDGRDLYFSAFEGLGKVNTLFKLTTTGTATELVGGGGHHLTYANGRFFFTRDAVMAKRDAASEPTRLMASDPTGIWGGLAVIGAFVYAGKQAGPFANTSSIVKVPVSGGPASVVGTVSSRVVQLAGDSRDLYYTTGEGAVERISP